MQRVSQQLIQELNRKESVEVITETINVAKKGRIAFQTVGFLLKQMMRLPHKARESDADIILFSSMVTASLAFFIRHKITIPMVTINHGRDVTLPVKPYQWFVPKVFDNLDGVISVSRATRDECIARGMEPEKGVALPNGFDFNKLNNFPDKKESRNRLQRNFRIPLESHTMLLTVGRMVKRKGHEWFIREVMPKLDERVVYVTVGDGPEYDSIVKAAEGTSFRDRIFILGRQPDEVLQQAYAAADLFVMPNVPVPGDMEGFGIVLLEANMAETPAVAANLEGIKDVITQGKNGYRVPALDAETFAAKIDEVLTGPLEQFSKGTRTYVQEQFSWQHVAQQYVDYLDEKINHF
ncbi:glycosyltransferase family 4 protein [Aliifodinibius halophilus]|uniref:Glycosyltransferase family 4 protein n=2 Tax=Fodinibius halophilus TaxID=1736908 RepID=A0A6M1T6N2_9BACT|nr:glycosyltransferase family 4 protein [Fodinibius halophilus]NGP88283.1 glycosyltransferase family 4 protein [Fodinibius halophilus]